MPRTRDWPYSVNCQFGSVSSVYNWATRVDSLTPSITRLLTHPPHFLPTFLTTTYWCIWYVVRAVCHLLNVQANLMGIDSRKMDGGSKKRSHHIWFHATPDLSSAATSAPSTIAPGQRRACACVIQVDPSRSKLGKHCDWSCHEIHCKGSKQCTKAEVCKGSSHGVDNKGRSSQKGHSYGVRAPSERVREPGGCPQQCQRGQAKGDFAVQEKPGESPRPQKSSQGPCRCRCCHPAAPRSRYTRAHSFKAAQTAAEHKTQNTAWKSNG